MISSVSEVLATFTSALRSRWELVFEHLALSHQVMVMQRSRRKPQFGGADRFFWILLSTGTADSVFWRQSVAVTTNTPYIFSAWTLRFDSDFSPTQYFAINLTSQGPVFPLLVTPSGWQGNGVEWNSGTSTVAVLELRLQTGHSGPGNNLAVDDIAFVRASDLPPPRIAITATNSAAQLGWFSYPGPSYQLQWAAEVNTNTSWFDLGSPVVGTGTTNYVNDSIVGNRRFYRVIRTGHQTWATVADMPTGRDTLGAAVGADGPIYAIGGQDATGPVDTVEAYTPGTPGSWATMASMPTPRYGLAVIAGADGRIYAIGGNTSGGRLTTLEVYTPSTDSWATKASMSSSRVFLSAAAGADGRIYAMGGLGDSGTLATVEVYTPSSDSWATATSMTTARQSFAAAAGADGRIYVMGGGYLNTVEAFTPNAGAGTWANKASMQAIRSDLAAAAGADGRIYAIGGDGGTFNLATVEAYTPSTDSWVTVPSMMPTRRASLAAAAGADGRIYAIGGQDFANRTMPTVEAYTP
jgi:N-acetylneuraminic acid mutarotase